MREAFKVGFEFSIKQIVCFEVRFSEKSLNNQPKENAYV